MPGEMGAGQMRAGETLLEPGRNCWRTARADKAALVVDACDYFGLAREAMLKARSQILLVGWDFDTRILLDEKHGKGEPPVRLGPFLSWLARNRPGLDIHILKWDLGVIKLLGRGSTVFRLARWAWNEQIHFKLDGAHPFGGSHHHKILVVDDALAFCGGIDMTASRWDTREHADKDPRRRRPTTGRRYGPWHDATMAVSGPAAAALGDHARTRWEAAGGEPLEPPEEKGEPWPEALEPQFRDVEVAIARTRGAHDGNEGVREIEALFVDMIGRARRFIYAENQYFASRAIGAAIAARLAEPDGPEFVLVNPESCAGWLEEPAMGSARARLVRLMEETGHGDRFRIYTPKTEQGEDIYVHSKVMIVDDELLRVGSANMNNRSMGLDSECDVLVGHEGGEGMSERIAAIRAGLMAEHLGVEADAVEAKLAETGSLIATVEALRGEGRTLAPFEPPEPGSFGATLAENQLVDPEASSEDYEAVARPGLYQGFRAALRRRHKRKAA